MIIIKHRCNSVSKLKKTSINYGIEVDLRSFGKKLIVNHNPFENGVCFEKWIGNYSHKFLILNVKEEGLEKRLLSIMKKKKINNFFFLDQSFPFLVKTLKLKEKRCALRISDYESAQTAFEIKLKPNWIWLDCFEKSNFNLKMLNKLKKLSYKICIVSPELHNIKRTKEIKNLLKKINKLNFKFDAVCTKKPLMWKKYYENERNS